MITTCTSAQYPHLTHSFCGSNHCSFWFHSNPVPLSASTLNSFSTFYLHFYYTAFFSGCGLIPLISFIVIFFFLFFQFLIHYLPLCFLVLLSHFTETAFSKITNDLIVKVSDTYTASDSFDYSSCFFFFLTFWLHNTFSLFSSYFWNADSNLLVNVYQLSF